jgi:hypothetical protein
VVFVHDHLRLFMLYRWSIGGWPYLAMISAFTVHPQRLPLKWLDPGQSDGRDLFVILNGVKIAKRGLAARRTPANGCR